MTGWYRDNLPGTGKWRIADAAVDPAALRCPAFVAVPGRDRIVPPESATPLTERTPGAVLHRPEASHIGMTTGPRAEQTLWAPPLGWLRGLGPPT